MTKLSSLRRVRFGGVNWIPDNSRLSSTENLKSEHVQSNRPIHASTPDTTKTGLSCRVWCELSRPDRPTSAFSIGVCRGAQTLLVRPPDALVGPTQFILPRQTRQDCRACLSTAAATT